jgi:ketopantoate reductase
MSKNPIIDPIPDSFLTLPIEKSVQELFLTKKKITVIGGGNVGTFLAAAILNGSKNCDLTIIENNEERREQIKQHGLGYEAGSGEEKITATISSEKFKVEDSIATNPEIADIVFIATKSYQLTPEFYRQEIAPFLHENSKVVLVQNGYPNSEILTAIGNKDVLMVVNAGFSLDEQGAKTVTNKSEIDLPYGSLSKTSSREKLQEEIGQLFLGNPPRLSARCDDNIIVDIIDPLRNTTNHFNSDKFLTTTQKIS